MAVSPEIMTDGMILKVLILTPEDSTAAGHDSPGKDKMETKSLKEKKIIKCLSGNSKQIKLKFSKFKKYFKTRGLTI